MRQFFGSCPVKLVTVKSELVFGVASVGYELTQMSWNSRINSLIVNCEFELTHLTRVIYEFELIQYLCEFEL